MYQLRTFDPADLNAGKTAISGTPAREEDFTLDATGDWTGCVQKTSGTTVLNQARVHNHVNEIDVDDNHANAPGASITATVGANWADPVQDAAGNMTTLPNPSSLASGLTCKYDAWHRLVEVQEGGSVSTRYEYFCPCQLPGAGFLGRVGWPLSLQAGRWSLSHSSMAA